MGEIGRERISITGSERSHKPSLMRQAKRLLSLPETLHTISNRFRTAKVQRLLSQLYTHCDELPLKNFIEIVVTGDLKHLSHSGNVINSESAEVWDALYNDYVQRAGGRMVSDAIRLASQINSLQLRIMAIEKALNALKFEKSKVIIDALGEIGYKVDETAEGDAYQENIERIRRRAASLGVDLMQKKAKLQALNAGNDKTKADREYFNKLILAVEKNVGFKILPELVSVGMFCTYLNALKEEKTPLKHG